MYDTALESYLYVNHAKNISLWKSWETRSPAVALIKNLEYFNPQQFWIKVEFVQRVFNRD